jgi:uncharacterized protein (UPF0210 family)
MKIRSITTLLHPGSPPDEKLLDQMAAFNTAARAAVQSAGYTVQTTRLATPPFPLLVPNPADAVPFAREIERAALARGWQYVCLGPALPADLRHYAVLPEVFAATENVFAAGIIADSAGVSLPAVRAAADVMHRCAALNPSGFGNLYFAALANVPPGSPFFPAAYHDGGAPAFALATEAADLAVDAFGAARSLAQARQNLIAAIEQHARQLEAGIAGVTAEYGIRYMGLDFTLAPFPAQAQSIGAALERLGVPALGWHGSLAAAAFLVDTLHRAQYTNTGFNGLMLPLLEDWTLARRAAEGHLTVTDLLLYSAVCGTGLDTIPLPGDTDPDGLAAVLLDLASLSARLSKPLTARLLPIPGKRAGEMTAFDFPFFANSRVLALNARPLAGLLAGGETFLA